MSSDSNKLEKIRKIFNPKAIAVIGASERQESVGYAVLNNLLTMGYEGKVFPINPKRPQVLGATAYPSVAETPEKADLAVVATPAGTVPGLVEECGKAGITSLVIITSGFSEIGEEGKALEAEILRLLNKYNIRAVGPNCLGVMNPSVKMNASFAGKMPYSGKVGFISQSGALCTSILDWAIKHHIGFSNFVSIGSMMDLEFSDLIEYFDQDQQTESIILYIESIKKPEEFIKAARKFTSKKPIFAIKAGRFEEGAAAAASHTGALAGADDVYDAALKRAGIVRVQKIEDLINVAQSLSMQSLPEGNRMCIITNAGGPGVITTDALVERGGKLSKLSEEVKNELNQALPPFWSHSNPVDVLGDAQADRYEKALELCMKDPNSDAITVILTPQAMSEPVPTARSIARIAKKYNKPIFTSWMGADYVEEGVKILLQSGVPSYSCPEPAIDAFSMMCRYKELKQLLDNSDKSSSDTSLKVSEETKKKYKNLMKEIAAGGERNFLNEIEAKGLLEEYGIPTTKTSLATSAEEAASIAEKIGFPVVMKIQSPDILHKTDAGGVLLGLKSTEDVKDGFKRIMENAKAYNSKAKLEGVAVQKMVNLSGGTELIIGLKKDSLWGPTVIFGAGGVNVELLKDKTISLMPLNRKLVQESIQGTKIYKLLAGYRGQAGANMTYLEDIVLNFGKLVSDFPEIQEIDINPLVIKGNDAYALDARVIF